MPQGTDPKQTCPYLGLAADRDSRFSYPETAHLCFATDRATPISLEHQSAFCFTQRYPTCPRFVEPPLEEPPLKAALAAAHEAKIERPGRVPVWAIVLGALTSLLVVVAIFHFYLRSVFQPEPVSTSAVGAAPTPIPSLAATPTPGEALLESTPTPLVVVLVPTPTPTPTSAAGDRTYTLSPATRDAGWVTSGEERGNHFGDSFLYAGILDGQVYQAAFQFDLSSIPRGAPIHEAALQLTGLRGDQLSAGGAWTLRLLAPEIDQNWRRHNYQEIFNATALQALTPILGEQDLAEGHTNVFVLSPAQIKVLETHIVENENPKVSFRIEGPVVGSDNLFAWDTGYGPKSQGNKVALILSVGPAPATPPPYNYVVVTSTPTPENVLTAAALVLQMTADATRIGTATPVPPNMATATPLPGYLVIVASPTPENDATAQALVALGTAEALTTGTPTPLPTNAVTATPTPSATPTPTYVLITATPTPESIFAAATLSVAGTARAQRLGMPTPLPSNWVTPIVVTSTPTPANAATAEALALQGTAQAFTTGTPSPTPANMVTATPTPVFVLLNGELPPMTPTPAPPVVPNTVPRELMGKIAFKSDRSGQEQVYVTNPDGSGLALLSDRLPYCLAQLADPYSADARFRVFVKDAIVNTGSQDATGKVKPVQLKVPSLFVSDSLYKGEVQITHFGADVGHLPLAYEPAWSPTAERIAFVSDDSGNDEIWVTNRDGSDMRQLTWNQWEWDKHPSWSPDGSKIVFWSNRTGHQQIWVMDPDGSNLYSLSRTGFNDWDPVWIKYPDVPEPVVRPPGATAICNDCGISYSADRSGTCADHGGVMQWLK